MGEEVQEEEWLGIHRLLGLAEKVTTEFFAGEVWPIPLAAVAYIESGGNPRATRFESHLGTCSVGLCQTLLVTARWLVTDTTPELPPGRLYHRPVGAPVPKPPEISDPTQISLMDPFTSMWYGAAYLSHLSIYGHRGRSEEWTVRAYNAGPTGIETKNTDKYWLKYSIAKKVIMDGLCASLRGGCLYQIRQGDTLWSIAQTYCVSLSRLEISNDQIQDPAMLSIGQLLVVPGKKAVKRKSSKIRSPPSRRGSGWKTIDTQLVDSDAPRDWWTIIARVLIGTALIAGGVAALGAFSTRQPTALLDRPVFEDPRRLAAPSPPEEEGRDKLPKSPPLSSPPPPAATNEISARSITASSTVMPVSHGKTYVIGPGDTLSRIARENGCSVSGLLQSNPRLVANPNLIEVGMLLNIPPPT